MQEKLICVGNIRPPSHSIFMVLAIHLVKLCRPEWF